MKYQITGYVRCNTVFTSSLNTDLGLGVIFRDIFLIHM